MLAVPGVASVNRYHSDAPVGLRPIARPSSEMSARTAVTTVSPSGSATYTVTGDFTAKRAAVNESLAKPLGCTRNVRVSFRLSRSLGSSLR